MNEAASKVAADGSTSAPFVRDALRACSAMYAERGDGAVYAECDNATERLLLAVGGVSMGQVAGACNRTRLYVQANGRP